MDEKVTCISLRAVSFSDTGVMLTLWCRELGLVSAAVSLGAGRESRRRRALMMPSMVFEAVASRRGATDDVVRLSDVRAAAGYTSLSLTPMRTVVATFLAEVLSFVLRNQEPEAPLNNFIFTSWQRLAKASGRELANFHVMFLVKLTRFLGIEPDYSTYRPGCCFDLRDAVFRTSMPSHGQGLEPDAARLAGFLLRLDCEGILRLPLTRQIRNRAIDILLDFYTIHHTPLTSLRSLTILRDICR